MNVNLVPVDDSFDLPVNTGIFRYDSEVGGQLKVEEAQDILHSTSYFKKSVGPVLGKIIGNYFIPNGKSLNNRFYSEDLWRNTLSRPDVRKKLEDGMLGMMEHPPLISFYTKDGQVSGSHPIYACLVTKKLYIRDEGGKLVGKGEGFVVDTPVGRILDVLLRSTDEAGQPLVRFYMSSRALGRYVGKTEDNYNIMDPVHYYLSTFDIVRNPGLPGTVIEYKEAKESITDELIEKVVREIYEGSVQKSKFLQSYKPLSKALGKMLENLSK